MYFTNYTILIDDIFMSNNLFTGYDPLGYLSLTPFVAKKLYDVFGLENYPVVNTIYGINSGSMVVNDLYCAVLLDLDEDKFLKRKSKELEDIAELMIKINRYSTSLLIELLEKASNNSASKVMQALDVSALRMVMFGFTLPLSLANVKTNYLDSSIEDINLSKDLCEVLKDNHMIKVSDILNEIKTTNDIKCLSMANRKEIAMKFEELRISFPF